MRPAPLRHAQDVSAFAEDAAKALQRFVVAHDVIRWLQENHIVASNLDAGELAQDFARHTGSDVVGSAVFGALAQFDAEAERFAQSQKPKRRKVR